MSGRDSKQAAVVGRTPTFMEQIAAIPVKNALRHIRDSANHAVNMQETQRLLQDNGGILAGGTRDPSRALREYLRKITAADKDESEFLEDFVNTAVLFFEAGADPENAGGSGETANRIAKQKELPLKDIHSLYSNAKKEMAAREAHAPAAGVEEAAQKAAAAIIRKGPVETKQGSSQKPVVGEKDYDSMDEFYDDDDDEPQQYQPPSVEQIDTIHMRHLFTVTNLFINAAKTGTLDEADRVYIESIRDKMTPEAWFEKIGLQRVKMDGDLNPFLLTVIMENGPLEAMHLFFPPRRKGRIYTDTHEYYVFGGLCKGSTHPAFDLLCAADSPFGPSRKGQSDHEAIAWKKIMEMRDGNPQKPRLRYEALVSLKKLHDEKKRAGVESNIDRDYPLAEIATLQQQFGPPLLSQLYVPEVSSTATPSARPLGGGGGVGAGGSLSSASAAPNSSFHSPPRSSSASSASPTSSSSSFKPGKKD